MTRAMLTLLIAWATTGCTASEQASPDQVAELEARVAEAERALTERQRRPFAADRAACDRFIDLAAAEGMFVGPDGQEFRERAWLGCVVEATASTKDVVEAKAAIIHDCAARASDSAHLRACYTATKYRNDYDEDELRKLVDCTLTTTNAEEIERCDP